MYFSSAELSPGNDEYRNCYFLLIDNIHKSPDTLICGFQEFITEKQIFPLFSHSHRRPNFPDNGTDSPKLLQDTF